MSGLYKEDEKLSLFAVLLGSTPKGRNTEQHDVMFGVAHQLSDLYSNMKTFWHKTAIADVAATVQKLHPGIDAAELANELLPVFTKRDRVHVDGYIQVNYVNGYRVDIIPAAMAGPNNGLRLYFINLGGYLDGEFEELHKKFFVVANNVSEALNQAKQHAFMKQYSGGTPHLDDQHKMDFDTDDVICISDMLDDKYALHLVQSPNHPENPMVMGYIKLAY